MIPGSQLWCSAAVLVVNDVARWRERETTASLAAENREARGV